MINLAVGRGPSPRSVMQGQCKPNAESLLFAEVQPVLAMSIAKLGTKKDVRKLSSAKILSFSEQPINRGENKKRDN